MLLSCVRCECNADRCPSRKCDKYMHSVWTAWFKFRRKQDLLRIDVLFFHNILNEQHSSAASSGFKIKILIGMQFLHLNMDFYFKFDKYCTFF